MDTSGAATTGVVEATLLLCSRSRLGESSSLDSYSMPREVIFILKVNCRWYKSNQTDVGSKSGMYIQSVDRQIPCYVW